MLPRWIPQPLRRIAIPRHSREGHRSRCDPCRRAAAAQTLVILQWRNVHVPQSRLSARVHARAARPSFTFFPCLRSRRLWRPHFPATLGIDDPGVGDELALPTITYLHQNSDGSQEVDATFSYTKTIFPGFGLSVSDGPTWLKPGGYGWGNLDTEAKYNFYCNSDHEFMASAGLDVTWANTGTPNMSDPFNTYQPVLDLGKGFGDLPTSLNILRPFAVTFELSESVPDQAWTDGNQNPTNLNWGFTIQYSLPYYNSNVAEIDNEFFRRLVPITEFTFSKPIANYALGTNQTTGTI